MDYGEYCGFGSQQETTHYYLMSFGEKKGFTQFQLPKPAYVVKIPDLLLIFRIFYLEFEPVHEDEDGEGCKSSELTNSTKLTTLLVNVKIIHMGPTCRRKQRPTLKGSFTQPCSSSRKWCRWKSWSFSKLPKTLPLWPLRSCGTSALSSSGK